MRMASRMKTEAQKRANREAQRRYRQTAKGKEHQKRYRQSAERREIDKAYRQTAEYKAMMRRYCATITGVLHNKYGSIRYRCNNPDGKRYHCYGGRGIKCLFKSLDDFRDYVINELKVDPRGLQIHRIDNDGHYERGNIVFVTREEHKEIHMKL